MIGNDAYIIWDMDNVDPVTALFERASAHHVPMAAICQRAGIAQTTPSRWRKNRNGANLATVKALNEALSKILSEPTPQGRAA